MLESSVCHFEQLVLSVPLPKDKKGNHKGKHAVTCLFLVDGANAEKRIGRAKVTVSYSNPYLERHVDAADQGVQDVDAVMAMEQDEAEEGLEERWFRHAPQEQVQVGRGGHHLFQSQLQHGTWIMTQISCECFQFSIWPLVLHFIVFSED